MIPARSRGLGALLLAAVLSLLAGCETPTGPTHHGPLIVGTGPGMLIVENRGPVPLYTFMVERQVAAQINWAVCADPSACEGIPAGGRRVSPASDVYGYAPGREVIVHGWDLAASEDGFRVGTMWTVVVRP